MGYKITVNDEEVWESEGDPMLVDQVKVINSRGEVVTIGSPGLDAWLKIEVNIRDSADAAGSYLDLIEANKAQERREAIEAADVDRVAEGRAQMAEDADRESHEGVPSEASESNQDEGGTDTVSEEEKPEFGPPAPVSIPDLEM